MFVCSGCFKLRIELQFKKKVNCGLVLNYMILYVTVETDRVQPNIYEKSFRFNLKSKGYGCSCHMANEIYREFANR